jgi:hypothetical protein
MRTRSARTPAHYGSDDRLDPTQLTPGVTIRRYTEPVSGGRLDVAVPCCGRVARLPSTVDQVRVLVGCPCGLMFHATLIDEGDGGHACLLVVRDEHITLARRRSPRGRRTPPTAEA